MTETEQREVEEKLIGLWNKHRVTGMPKAMVSKKNQMSRLKRLSARWKDYPDFETWEKVFKFMANSAWYSGHNPQGWTASFGWAIQPQKFQTLVESSSSVSLSEEQDTASAIDDVLERMSG